MAIPQTSETDPLTIDVTASSVHQEGWENWILSRYYRYFIDQQSGQLIPFAQFHEEFWQWVWQLKPGVRPQPFVAVWSRNAGKSTNAELACVAVGELRVRSYILYISGNQDRADDHVQNIASLLESPELAVRDPELAQRMVGKFGNSKGWRRSRLRTASGLTVDALGLDTLARGAKIDDERPNLLIFDDIDREGDTEIQVLKKLKTITRSILPSGSHDVAVLMVQNLIHDQSVFSRLVTGRVDFLSDRCVSGPHKALDDFKYEIQDGRTVITHGIPRWPGLSVERCQQVIDNVGLSAFLSEYQHEQTPLEGTMLGDVWKSSIHVIDPFLIPEGWYIDRSFDWGSSRPFSVAWWAESDGSPVNGRHYPAGTLFRIYEWYGCEHNRPNQGLKMLAKDIAKGIKEIEQNKRWGHRVQPGPADASIFDDENGMSVARDMADEDVTWLPCDKGPGSRIEGARLVTEYLLSATRFPMDSPGLFIFNLCKHFQRTVPNLMRDPKRPEDVRTDGEDHQWDDTRYRINFRRHEITEIPWRTR